MGPQIAGRRPPRSAKLAGFGTSIFAEMTALARRHDAINLGQGFPNFDGPEFVKQAAVEALRAGHNQYSPMPGLPALQQAVADHQRRFYGLTYDPASEIRLSRGWTLERAFQRMARELREGSPAAERLRGMVELIEADRDASASFACA